jgi:hypothetical protein
VGEDGNVLIRGSDLQEVGITVSRASRVILERLTLQGFTRSALLILHSGPVEVVASKFQDNPGQGIESNQSEVLLADSLVQGNGGNGITCQGGSLSLRALEGGPGVVLSDNGGNAIRVTGCQGRIEGPARISGNSDGLVAEHGGEINLTNRSDIVVQVNNRAPGGGGPGQPAPPHPTPMPLSMVPRCELVADYHGVVSGYRNARVEGDCICREGSYGICSPE